MAVAISVPIAHLAHWAAVFYAAPVIVLLGWVGLARLVRALRSRNPEE